MFEKEFSNLPDEIKVILERQLEDAIRRLYRRYHLSVVDSETHFTFQEIHGIIYSVIRLAEEFKQKVSDEGPGAPTS